MMENNNETIRRTEQLERETSREEHTGISSGQSTPNSNTAQGPEVGKDDKGTNKSELKDPRMVLAFDLRIYTGESDPNSLMIDYKFTPDFDEEPLNMAQALGIQAIAYLQNQVERAMAEGQEAKKSSSIHLLDNFELLSQKNHIVHEAKRLNF